MKLYEKRPPRILISRLSHIGDCVLTMPLLSALRAHYKHAVIAWVVEPPTDQLLRKHESLDHLIVAPRGWMKSPKAIWQLRQQMRQHKFDVAIDPQSLTKSAVLAWLSGAKTRIGFARGAGRELAPILNNQLVKPSQPHVVDRQLELLRPLGIRRPSVKFQLPRDDRARRQIDDFIYRSHLGCGFAVINPGAGWRSRLWPPERFGAVAKHLGQTRSLPSVVAWAGDEERGWAEQIVARSGGHALLAPPTTLLELASLLRIARLYVGSDTGPMHIAVAAGTDSVVLHGTTRPEISGPYGPQHIAIQEYYQAGTSRERRSAGNEAMRAIQVESVCEACDRILERQAVGKSGVRAA